MTRPEHPSDESATRTILRGGRAVARRMRTYELLITDREGGVRVERVGMPVLRVGSRPNNDLVLSDDAVSRLHFEIVAEADGYRLRDLGSKNGTFVDGYRVGDIYLRAGARIRVGDLELTFQPTEEETEVLASPGESFGPVLGRSVPMRELFAVLERTASSDSTLLIEGESGTGKEILARAVHGASRRRAGPFVVLDCAALPPGLLESELFGHERGAFTGATDRRIGRIEEAHEGTLFADEIGELPLDMQPKLLRALETREVRRLGSSHPIGVDLRVVAATHRDLAIEINRGAFREDLYYRLAVVRVRVPPLRERPEDIPMLVEHFVRRAHATAPDRAERLLATVRETTWSQLVGHPWPGNVRELRNVVERSLALAPEGEIGDLDPQGRRPGGVLRGTLPDPRGGVDLDRTYMDEKADFTSRFDEAYLLGQLERHGGNISRAAAASGLERMQFKRLVRKIRD